MSHQLKNEETKKEFNVIWYLTYENEQIFQDIQIWKCGQINFDGEVIIFVILKKIRKIKKYYILNFTNFNF